MPVPTVSVLEFSVTVPAPLRVAICWLAPKLNVPPRQTDNCAAVPNDVALLEFRVTPAGISEYNCATWASVNAVL